MLAVTIHGLPLTSGEPFFQILVDGTKLFVLPGVMPAEKPWHQAVLAYAVPKESIKQLDPVECAMNAKVLARR